MSTPRRPVRGRDRLGRPVPLDDPGAVSEVPEQALPPAEALALAQTLLDEGRAFGAHEVLEASWKAAPPDERDLWQGLAQLCVGLTHLQRGNLVGAVRLLRRAAGRLPDDPPYGTAPGLGALATGLAERVAAGDAEVPALRLLVDDQTRAAPLRRSAVRPGPAAARSAARAPRTS